MKCPRCNADNPDTQKYCGECGTNIASAEEAQPQFTKTLETPFPRLTKGNILVDRYDILGEIGKGGMGEVYLAEDTNLKRRVAIKVLPQQFAFDKERLARFEREARLLASLNHPNIAIIHGLEKTDEQQILVMEFVEGETLRELLSKGPLPIDEALEICKQIAEGLESAHERGIIHRDLKPANVKVTPDGKVKILDFGIAKVFQDEAEHTGASQSPIITEEMTRPGVILGTAAYMSPEQAKGKRVDTRTDIWAFGCILYECLAGKRAFRGENISEMIASILKDDPDWDFMPDGIPVQIQGLMNRCLVKNPHNRLQHIGDARVFLMEGLEGMYDTDSGRTEKVKGTRRGLFRLFVLCLLMALVPLSFWVGRETKKIAVDIEAQESFTMTTVDLSDRPLLALDARLSLGVDNLLIDLSPDGRTLVYVGETESGTKLFVRNLDSLDVIPIEGSEGATHPFFSPDGQKVGFLTNEHVKTIDLEGGHPQILCNAHTPVIATWAVDGYIYFGEHEGTALGRVSTETRERQDILPIQSRLYYEKLLPDGRHVLATYLESAALSRDYAQIYVVSLSDGERKSLSIDGYGPQFISPGHILFGRGGDLFAVRFNLDSLEIEGQPWRIASNVRMCSNFNKIQAAASNNGIIAFIPGGDSSIGKLAWINRQGRHEFFDMMEGAYGKVDISPDGRHIAVQRMDVKDYIQILELPSQRSILLLKGPTHWLQPSWSHRGDKLAFSSRNAREESEILVQTLGSTRDPDVITSAEHALFVMTWGPGDERILANSFPINKRFYFPEAPSDPMPRGFAAEGEFDFFVDLDPSGNWVVFNTEEGIKVRSLDGEQEYPISLGFGAEPSWCDRCSELFYRDGNRIYSVEVRLKPEFQWEQPQLIWEVEDFYRHTRCLL